MLCDVFQILNVYLKCSLRCMFFSIIFNSQLDVCIQSIWGACLFLLWLIKGILFSLFTELWRRFQCLVLKIEKLKLHADCSFQGFGQRLLRPGFFIAVVQIVDHFSGHGCVFVGVRLWTKKNNDHVRGNRMQTLNGKEQHPLSGQRFECVTLGINKH